MFGNKSVAESPELKRIRDIPRRTWTEAESAKLAAELTAILRTPTGTQVLRPVQAVALYEILTLGRLFGAIRVGGGKCLGRDTRVRMLDGTTKAVQDVAIGDLLMGPDSTPRTVTSVCAGQEEMFKVTPIKGESFTANRSHILSIKNTPEKPGQKHTIENISIDEYLSKSEHWKRNAKLWRTGVNYSEKSLTIPPYVLGIWLGDGTSSGPSITSLDSEIVEEFKAWGASLGLGCRKTTGERTPTYFLTNGKKKIPNAALESLRKLSVVNNKHVPLQYLTASRGQRLELLAGLIDTDGHLAQGYDYISVSKHLATNVVELARSLGLAAYLKKCKKQCVNNGVWGEYYRVSISGNLDEVPCRLSRKKAAPRQQIKSHLVTGFSLESLGIGDYYGFELAGPDRLFLLEDFTVTHNTLITLLASTVLGSRRAVLILPAALIEKTEADRAEYAKHWRVDRALRLLSYEFLGRINGAETLNQWQPDLIIFDECHRVKNLKAAVTRRISRYFEAHPDTRALAMSGTILKHSLADFAHILHWTHKENAPIPPPGNELQEWCDALDEDSNPLNRMGVGALATLADPKERLEQSLLTCARRGFQRRLVETPGVVSTGGDKVDCSLYIESLAYDVQSVTEDNFRKLREDWATPDDWPLFEPMQVWRHARELALGHFYVWDPRPPDTWLKPRKEYARFVRETLKRSHHLDSELQVRKAVIADEIADDENTYAKWSKVSDTFEPNTKPVWCDMSAIEACKKWAKHGPGIIWTEHTFFARKLAKELGVHYYGQGGLNADGDTIEAGSGVVIASIGANSTGRNLQKWSRNLVTSPPTGADAWEQLLGRTHRDGQKADTVTVDVLVGCREHLDALTRAVARAKMTRDTTGAEQKLLLADLIIHKQVNNNSPRWTKTEGKEE